MMKYIAYLISPTSLLLTNIIYIESLKHFDFVFACVIVIARR